MTEVFEAHRPALTRLAYQLLGSIGQAEDAVQETFLRWQGVDTRAIEHPRAFLRRVLTRLCLDALKSARAQREMYVGPWLPEPLLDDEPVASQDVTVALLLALERLSPPERAAFILHDVFDVGFDEIGRVLDRSAMAARKLASRARTHVHAARPRHPVSEERAQDLVAAFLTAARSGDRAALTALLVQDAQLHTDGGGRRNAALRVIVGADRIARFFTGLARQGNGPSGAHAEVTVVNGAKGLLLTDDEGQVETYAFAFDGDRVRAIYVCRNPEKLGHLTVRGST